MQFLINPDKILWISFFHRIEQAIIVFQIFDGIGHLKTGLYVIHYIIKNLVPVVFSVFFQELAYLNIKRIIMLNFVLFKIVHLIFVCHITIIFIPALQFRRVWYIKLMTASVFYQIFSIFFGKKFI